MKNYNPIYYLLFILVVTGAFASMAQNSYGIKMMGGVAFAFGLVFLVECFSAILSKDKKDGYALIETACLSLLSLIFGCRVFYIHFPFIEMAFATTVILLLLLYLRKMILLFRDMKSKNKWMVTLLLSYYTSLLLFLISLLSIEFRPKISATAGTAAFVLLLAFILAGFLKKDLLVEGDKVSAFRLIKHFKDHSIVILSLFLLMSLYVGLNKMGAIPDIYSDQFPQVYYRLVHEAASGKEKPVNGKYKYEIFREKYDRFLQQNKIGKK
jgi:hypothetical protein